MNVVVDWEAAGAWRDHVQAFAMVESSGDPDIKPSDDRQARGLLGMHPAQFRTYYGKVEQFAASVKDTWETSDIKTCAAFLEIEVPRLSKEFGINVGLDLAVQAWNKGVEAVEGGVRNLDYLDKWTRFFQGIRSGKLVILIPKGGWV